jgi:hypothetical protein
MASNSGIGTAIIRDVGADRRRFPCSSEAIYLDLERERGYMVASHQLIKQSYTMSGSERVHLYLRTHVLQAFCDDCLENETGVDREQISVIADTLGLFPTDFTRTVGLCPQHCSNRDKPITFAI